VKVSVAAFVCIGFLVGGLLGAMFVEKIPELALKRIFGIFLILVALRMIFSK
jgi:hypothetical protein